MKSSAEIVTDVDIQALQESLLEKEALIEKKSEVIAQLKQRIDNLEAHLRLARDKQFGKSSEAHPDQPDLFNEVEKIADEDEAASEKKASPKKPGRKPFSDNLPREQVYIDLPEEEKAGAIDTFYTKVKEELDIIPAQVRVLEYMQERAVFLEDGEWRIKNASMPKHPIGKAMASIQLLVFIIISKYMDGLPLHRLERVLQRYDGNITRTSMANWVIALSVQCQPLIHLIRANQHSAPLIHADETRIQVHKEPGYDNNGQKQMWVTCGGPADKPSVLFEYDPTRSGEVAMRLLDGYQGYVQTGYGAYKAVCNQPGMVHIGCWDHARRKLIDAQKGQPKGKQRKTSKADVAVNMIGKLYAVERQIKSLSTEEKYHQRQKQAKPILEKLESWVITHKDKVAKGSLTAKAMPYLINQWPYLIRYCDDGRIPISNNKAENAIRPFVVGRKRGYSQIHLKVRAPVRSFIA